ncbi:MAG TPA: 50S ribosomal protein L6 [Candidatus Hydrogenedentes bacterium]|nr:50S ribosomal protein L6 [Candidatus Hydrogenedentota bacterium]HQM49953.1 50S ribosomal protein L6 [Candidatus Hydrogenedentota bacterium]
MSRVGKLPVAIPDGVKVEVSARRIHVAGPKGTLEHFIHPDVSVALENNQIVVSRSSDNPEVRSLHGLTRALIYNLVVGVTQGYQRVLQIEGVGYRASMQGKSLNLAVGHSHPVVVEPPAGIAFEVEGTQTIKVSGIDKQLVGQVAANIRAWRKPEPYQGKGIRYRDERIRRKVGKAGAG